MVQYLSFESETMYEVNKALNQKTRTLNDTNKHMYFHRRKFDSCQVAHVYIWNVVFLRLEYILILFGLKLEHVC